MSGYLMVKHTHMTLAVLSLLFFILRAGWSISGSSLLARPFVRIAPHVIDTLLLACGLYLLSFIGMQTFIVAKLIGLVLYIVLGTMAIKRARTAGQKAIFATLAVLTFAYIMGAAIRHSPWSWFTPMLGA
ncbi:SirB2 family protein [Advenella mimigardefordensis]|uniref:Putative invasion gene expression up-regulator SirB n=1 Tax=Advenella mimigardefordensis (strain DSM 17166 / LMG 22922 / DPN7) TaxID=1247726 RepID=W0PDU6_ADVMD|nr:SirB2 family protein [Advenella mimigardefordensis]AHG63642.1 putative invasion gene expression up-regulator SirB [Advenella mimigardefordensis DPN7]